MNVQTIDTAPDLQLTINANPMTNNQATKPDSPTQGGRPKAVGLVRGDVSGLAAPRHADAVTRHALKRGYQYLYTVRPPQDAPDPVGYLLGIAAGLDAAAVVVYDLAQVDNQPARICEDFALETVHPAETWVRTTHPAQAETGVA